MSDELKPFGHTSLSISRRRGSMGQTMYRCECCDAEAPEIEAVLHGDDCPVQYPDDVELPMSETSDNEIMQLLYRLTDLFETGRVETTDEAIEQVRDWDGIRWVASGSTSRFVMGLGRTTTRGKFHLEDRRPVVLKFDPFIRYGDSITPVSGNVDELLTWEKAVQTGTQIFFADILGCARDGMWELMEECTPVYPKHVSLMRERDAIWDMNRDYLDPLRASLKVHGWENPDWKHGNIGIPYGDSVGVMTDYGTGPTFNPDAVVEDHVNAGVVERAVGEFPPQ